MSATETSLTFSDIVEGRALPPPSARLLGWRFVSLDAEAGVLRCAFTATEVFLNPAGVIQGGILASMLDEAMGPVTAAVSGGAVFAQTLEMKISYLRAARPGEIFGEARLVQRGRDILFLDGRLTDGDGRVLATASATARAVAAKG